MKLKNKQKITESSLATIVDEIEKSLLEDKELNEGFLKNAAIAGLLGLAFYTGMELTSAKNTPLGKAMQQAAEQGDEYAEYHLDRLDLYADAGAHKIMTQLSNKYLGNIKDRKMKNRRVDEYDLTEKDEDDPCWDGYEQYGMKTKDGKEVPNCVPVSESSLTEEESLLAAMKDTTIAESMGISSKEARASLRSKYGYDDLAIARAQLDETTSAGSVATVSAPIRGTKKRNMSEEENDDYQDYLEYRAEARATGQEVMSYDDWSGKTSARGRADDRYNRALQYYDLDDPAIDDFMEGTMKTKSNSTKKHGKSKRKIKESTSEMHKKLPQGETVEFNTGRYYAPEGQIIEATWIDTKSNGNIAVVAFNDKTRRIMGIVEVPVVGDVISATDVMDRYDAGGYEIPTRSEYSSLINEEMDNKDSDFDSAWFYKTEADDVEGPFDSKKAASDAAKGREEWVKQGKDLTDGDRRLAKRAHILSSTVLESSLVSEYEQKFRKQLNESMGVNVNVESDQPDSKNITVTASGEDADALAGLLANAGLFSSSGYGEVQFQEPDSEPTSSCGCGSESEMTMEEEGEYSNSPDEKYQDMEYMLNVVSGGLNREKKSYDNAEDGDNPMAVVKEEEDIAVGNMDEFYSYVLDFYGPDGIYDIGATEEEVEKATEIVKNEVGDEFEGDSVDREKVRDVILDQMRSEEEREEAEKAFRSSDYTPLDYDIDVSDYGADPIQTRGDVDDDMDRMRNFNETDNDVASQELTDELKGPMWRYEDARGVEQTGEFIRSIEGQGTDVTYAFKNSKTGATDMVSGSRLRNASRIRNEANEIKRLAGLV